MKFTCSISLCDFRALQSRVMIVSSQRVLVQGELVPRTIELADQQIALVAEHHAPGDWDFGNLILLPGIVDIHGDAFERQWMPRPRVFFPIELALLETDRQMLANGITTSYHGLTVSWEPGLRGLEHGQSMIDAVDEIRPQLRCDTRMHLRYEVFALDQVNRLLSWIQSGKVDLIGFNDHLGMIEAQLGNENKAGKYAERSGLTIEGFRRRLMEMKSRAGEVRGKVEQVAALGRERNIPMASHDDETPEMRANYAELGVGICEFPVDEVTARSAMDASSEVVMGSPNVVRGGSHANRMTAIEAIRGGYCSILSSDYFYPSILYAAFRIAAEGVLSLADAWKLVSENPARAAGLADRGRIAPGLRADFVVVDDSHPGHPRVAATITAGEIVYCAEPALLKKAASA